MMKQAISVTLAADNVVWLRGRARALRQSVSGVMDSLVSEARAAGPGGSAKPGSVVGMVTIDPIDPNLEEADAAVRALFADARRKDEPATRWPALVAERGPNPRRR